MYKQRRGGGQSKSGGHKEPLVQCRPLWGIRSHHPKPQTGLDSPGSERAACLPRVCELLFTQAPGPSA